MAFPGLAAALLAVATLSSGPVLALQSAPTVARGALDAQQAYAERLQRMALDGPTERAAAGDPDQNPRRARRAEAAAALINAGDCPGALALAETRPGPPACCTHLTGVRRGHGVDPRRRDPGAQLTATATGPRLSPSETRRMVGRPVDNVRALSRSGKGCAPSGGPAGRQPRK